MTSTAIVSVRARRVWDSRGRPTVEAEIGLHGGARGRAIAPAGASVGSGEARELRDGGQALGGFDVTRALAGMNGEIAKTLIGRDPADQEGLDRALIALDGTPDKSRLGGNALIAVSMATAQAAAAAAGEPLWRYLADGKPCRLPLPEVQIFGGGAHAARRVDVQDFMVIAVGAADYTQALEWSAEVYRAAGELMADSGLLHGVADEGGYWPAFSHNEAALEMLVRAIERARLVPGRDMAISLDIAASELGSSGRYRLASEGRELDSDGLCEMLLGWTQRYPIVSIEDPLGEDDGDGFKHFTRATAGRVQVVGDDFLATSAARIERAAAQGACNAALIKPNQAGTLTETKAAFDAARKAGWGAIVSARSGETEDVTIVHLAVGWGVAQLKVGAFARSERMAKWNEGLRIAEKLGDCAGLTPRASNNAPLSGRGELPPRDSFSWGRK